MILLRRFKVPSARPVAVAVIASAADLRRAANLRRAPDLFELRLDALRGALSADGGRIAALRAPLIITARHPAEGGRGNLRTRQRAALLMQFLPYAACIDVELRSATAMASVLEAANEQQVRRIISVHAIQHPASLQQLRTWADAAQGFGPDIFKVAVRTDSAAELETLISFFETEKQRGPISAMGIGKLGRRSRIELARRGSAFVYAHLGRATAEGQLSLAETRRLIDTQVAPSPRLG